MTKTRRHAGKILGLMIISYFIGWPSLMNINDNSVGVQVKAPEEASISTHTDNQVYNRIQIPEKRGNRRKKNNSSRRSNPVQKDNKNKEGKHNSSENNLDNIIINSESHDYWWWKAYVEEASVIFQPSNNTDWCEDEGGGEPETNRRSLQEGKGVNSNEKDVFCPKNPTWFNTSEESRLPQRGLYLVKTTKAGSSTAAGVSVQIAEAIAAKKGLAESCPHHVHHGIAYLNRKEPYFMWTVVREPAKRAISKYFFADVSRKEQPFNSTILISQMHKQHRNFQLRYIGLQPGTKTTLYNPKTATNQQVIEMVQDIIRSYNFIAVTERMDESLVVMKLLYNIPDEAMVVLSSKRAGGFDDGHCNERCYKIQSSHTTPDVDEYVSTRFHLGNWDYYLYEAVNRSLDRTIDMLGRDRVEREVARHKKLEKLAEEKCYDTAVFPCTKEGVRPNTRSQESCYFGDVGCGHECVQRVIRDYVNSTP